ncbi:MAG: hypothetical protein ACQKBY_12830, partial [Verrucomicrobiales bacterium]
MSSPNPTRQAPLPLPDLMFMPGPQGLVVGYGPFRKFAEPPASGTAFYRQTYALGEEKPWLIPSRLELGEWPEVEGGLPQVSWAEMNPDGFAEVFSEVMKTIRSGQLEKCVPVFVEKGRIESGEVSTLLRTLRDLPENLT